MSNIPGSSDPLDFVRQMWGNMGFNLPGMVTPTLDVDELDKRITDMKAVEGWLKMNLNMLQMTIQGLEVQRSTLAAVQAMSRTREDGEAADNPFMSAAAMWPWNMMNTQAPGSPDSAGSPPKTSTKAAERSTGKPATGGSDTKKD